MKVIVAAGGRFHAVQLAQQLYKRHLLQRLYSWSSSSYEELCFKDHLRMKRTMKWINKAYEFFKLYKILSPAQWYVLHDNYFDRWLSKRLKNEQAFDIFVGWAHYVLKSIPVARERGAKIIIEMGSMHILENQRILQEELALYGYQAPPIAQSNIDKMLQEYELTDFIMTPSSHVVNSFLKRGFDQSKLLQVPYGTNVRQFSCRRKKPKKYKVIFVGRVGFAKGMRYLLDAWKSLHFGNNHAELHIVGPVDSQVESWLKKQNIPSTIIFHGGVSHYTLAHLYQQASLFVLPSLQEGLAMVLLEAMSSGLPILATNRTGAQDIIQEERHGFIVEPNDTKILAEKILWGYKNQDALFAMGQKASLCAQKYSWDAYGDRVVQVYERIIAGDTFLNAGQRHGQATSF